MDRSNHQNLILLRNIQHKLDDFVASRRIQSTGWFVKEKDPRRSDELASDTDTSFLATRDTFADGSADKSVGLVDEAKGG
jgi:hypothetical protein